MENAGQSKESMTTLHKATTNVNICFAWKYAFRCCWGKRLEFLQCCLIRFMKLKFVQ